MAALALMTAACSNDDNDITRQPAKAEGIPFTATIGMGDSQTRALSDPDGDGKIQATWADGEHVALVYKVGGTTVVTDAEVTKQTDNSATISATIDAGVTTGTAVTLIYPYSAVNLTAGDDYGKVRSDLFTAQNGLLTGDGSISATCDLRQGSGTITLATTPASLSSNVTMASQIAIWKLTLNNYEDATPTTLSAKKLTIKDGSDNTLAATATLGSAISEFYMAVPAISSKDIKIEAVKGSDTYVLSKSGVTLTASTYYQSTAKLARPLSSAKAPSGYDMTSASPGDVGKVVSADGRLFATTAAATAAGTSGVAMICRVTSVGHGLAIELNSSPGTSYWYNAPATATSGKTAVPGSTEWRLPSNADWSSMFDGCNIADNPVGAAVPSSETADRAITSFRNKYSTATGESLPEDRYWSSTEHDVDNAWFVGLDSSAASFGTFRKDRDYIRVLACLAF